MATEKSPSSLTRFLDALQSSQLLMLLTGVMLIDFIVPDPLPFVDEIVLGLATLLLARWRMRSSSRRSASKPSPKNVTPESER